MALDTSNFWKAVENRETITYYRRTAQNTFASPQSIPNAKRRAATKDEVDGAAILGRLALVFHVWRNQLPDGILPPKPKDKILDTYGLTWTIQKVEIQSFGNRFRCSCIEERS